MCERMVHRTYIQRERRVYLFLSITVAALLSSCGSQQRDLDGFGHTLTDGELAGQKYAEFDQLRDRGAGSTFEGFPCFTGCTEHVAGYRWAEQQSDISAADCRRRSWAFTEGCVVFLSETGLFEGPDFE